MTTLVTIVGTRPQFIKASVLSPELRKRCREVVVHTGQHYDESLVDRLCADLGSPPFDHVLGVGSGPHGAQTGAMLTRIEQVLEQERPRAVVVYGDCNSTLAGALAAAKLAIPIAHVEAGLRSFDRTMPEEINRIVTDHVARWLFAPSQQAADQLAREGITTGVFVVGDLQSDTLEMHRERAAAKAGMLEDLGLVRGGYAVATVHRAANTDDPERLRRIFTALDRLGSPVVLPLHPRTRVRLREAGIQPGANVRVLEPLGFLEMLALEMHARCILTDSGGMQKEAYFLRVPCVTLRAETEWVETVASGWNVVAGDDPDAIVAAASVRPAPDHPHPRLYGEGSAARRIVDILTTELGEAR